MSISKQKVKNWKTKKKISGLEIFWKQNLELGSLLRLNKAVGKNGFS